MTYSRIKVVNSQNKYMSLGNACYYAAVVLLTIKTVLLSSELIIVDDIIDKLLFVICIAFILVKIFIFGTRLKVILLSAVIGILCLYNGIITGSYHIFMSYLVIAGSYRIDKRKMIKCISYTLICLISMHIGVYLMDLLFGSVNISLIMKDGEMVETRSFYLGHSNTASMYILWTVLSFLYLKYEKISKIHILLFIAFMGLIYSFTKSRTCFIATIMAACLIYVEKYVTRKKNMIFNTISKYGFIILSGLACVICIFYNSLSNVQTLNNLLTGRLGLASFALKTYGVTWLGKFIDFSQSYGNISDWEVTRLTIDIMPLRLLINFGIIYLIFYSVILFKSSRYILRKEALFVCLMIFYSFVEIFTVNAIMCFPLAICGWYLINQSYIDRYENIKEKELDLNYKEEVRRNVQYNYHYL